MRSLVFACAIALAGSGCSNGSSTAPLPPGPTPPQQWLLVSDVHFTPFDDPNLIPQLLAAPASRWHAILATSNRPPSPYFSDTNFALFESALAAMQATIPNPPAVIIPGDFMAHKFPDQFAKYVPNAPPGEYETFVDKTIAFLASEFDAAFPRAQFLITVGNNDGYCGNYQSTPHSLFLAHMAAAWEPLVDRNGNAPDFVHQFSAAGYYPARLPGQPKIPALALNSVYWSAFYKNTCGTQSDPGTAELNWLRPNLAAAPDALLMTHIPPGIDEYASLNNDAATPLYVESYTAQLLALLKDRGVAPRAFILGHIHHATFEIADTSAGQVGSLGVPSISPNQGNNPAFVVAEIASTPPTIVDTTTYALSLGAMGLWGKLYSFNAAYGLSAYTVPNLLKLDTRIASDSAVRAQFFDNYNSGSTTATPNPAKWPWYLCGHTNLTPQPYAACVGQTPPSARRRHGRTVTGTKSALPASSVMRAVHDPAASGFTE
jgi:sphingomyelin phosphodiesterase acid-like 3